MSRASRSRARLVPDNLVFNVEAHLYDKGKTPGSRGKEVKSCKVFVAHDILLYQPLLWWHLLLTPAMLEIWACKCYRKLLQNRNANADSDKDGNNVFPLEDNKGNITLLRLPNPDLFDGAKACHAGQEQQASMGINTQALKALNAASNGHRRSPTSHHSQQLQHAPELTKTATWREVLTTLDVDLCNVGAVQEEI
ncbi:hypothetical protein Rhopal_002993-T1 [Rhodotorula paludigena]|uniref:Uncharacterized protein n=1 Tax=Rhodotorula paludigena TaxID=86838 RepID=A0AAV5GKG8_9BASI|nr:hypothetical protein Rhopal_002993-T1 [Rhodotorula paludigena]